jgi:scyllo-inositol 2-dehydrogenase (NAD+)
MNKLETGVIGVGTLGRRHAENLRRAISEARLVAVADADGDRARRVANELEIEHSYDDIGALLARKDIEAVVIAAPSMFHAEFTCLAAAAGKHVFCEKPLALTLDDANSALEAVAKAGVQLQIGFMRRYDPAYANAKKRIDDGEIGESLIFKSVGRDKQLPPMSFLRAGNGMLFLDSTIHEFDLARWMMNDEVVEVHSFGGVLVCPELAQMGDIDAGLVNLRFARGGIGNVESFRQSQYGYDIRTEVVGSKGTLQVGYLQQTSFLTLHDKGVAYDVVDHWLVRFADAYLNELRDFVQTILAGGTPRVNGEQGLRALEISLAAGQSYRESRSVSLGIPGARARTTTANSSRLAK